MKKGTVGHVVQVYTNRKLEQNYTFFLRQLFFVLFCVFFFNTHFVNCKPSLAKKYKYTEAS